MRRLFRLIWWIGVFAAIAWLLRDRLVPAPEEAATEPPRYRVTPPPAPPAEPAPAAAADDDLEAIKGVGPVYAARLADAGITSFAVLAAADAADLAQRSKL